MQIFIGFSKSSGKFPIFSWLIQLFQRVNYSHAYLRLYIEAFNVDMIFQASGLEVNLVPYEEFLTKELVIKEYPLEITNKQYKDIIDFIISKLGQPYSILQIINTFSYILIKKNFFTNNEITGWDCSKLIADLLKEKLAYSITEDLDIITPKDLYNYLESKNGQY